MRRIRTRDALPVCPLLAIVLTALAGLATSRGRAALAPSAPVLLGRHAGRAMKRSRKAGLRGELRIECYLRERQFARSQFRHRVLQPNAAYAA